MQRARLLNAAVSAIDELGYARTSVALITTRARVSRKTFYDLFTGREDCLLEILRDTVATLGAELAVARVAEMVWRERVRTSLWLILCFLDREPALARVCVVQSARGGQRALEWREGLFAVLARAIDAGREQSARADRAPSLTAEGLVGAAVAVVHKRLLERRRDPLSALLGELMSVIVLPYRGAAAARSEQARTAPAKPAAIAAGAARAVRAVREDPLADVPMRLTYRTARVLSVILADPGASNRTVGEGADVYDQGQISKLLARLDRLGLVANSGQGHAKGEANAWSLTPLGVSVTQSLRMHEQTESAR
jgi:AcrR family transcriptional regulator